MTTRLAYASIPIGSAQPVDGAELFLRQLLQTQIVRRLQVQRSCVFCLQL